MTIFGVVIPFYNRLNGFSTCFESVLSQTTLPGYVVVVDDCSSDSVFIDLKLIVSSYSHPFKFLLIKNSTNQGPSFCRNIGRKAIENFCTHIAYLDSDDIWHTKKLFVVDNYIASHDPDVLLHTFTANSLDWDSMFQKKYQSDYLSLLRCVISNPLSPPCCVHKSQLAVFFDESLRFSEDYGFAIDLIIAKIPIYSIRLPLTLLGRTPSSPGGLSARRYAMRWNELLILLKYLSSSPNIFVFFCVTFVISAKLVKFSFNQIYRHLLSLLYTGK